MKIYVASSWRNQFQPEVVHSLRLEGHDVYDFRGSGDGWGCGGDGPGGFSWSECDPNWQSWPDDIPRYLAALQHHRAVEGFYRDMNALLACDVCLMVMPCGPSASMEMGWACGAGRLVIVYIPAMREPDLMVKMADYVGSDFQRILGLITAHERTKRNSMQRKISRWYRSNGGCAMALEAARRVQNELSELIKAVEDGDQNHAQEEGADVGICLAITMEQLRCDMLDKMEWKLGINEQRQWEVQLDGTLTHVKGSDPREVADV